MMNLTPDPSELQFHAVTAEHWLDLKAFFAAHGNPNYCWCMKWRLPSADYKRLKSAQRRDALAALVFDNVPVGVLAYWQGQAVGWCSIAPRETYALLENSSTLKRIDDASVWSVACFFVAPQQRGTGLALGLLNSAVTYAISCGASIIEGYPVAPDASYRFMGAPAIFAQAGFHEVAVAKNGRSIVRFVVN